MGSVIELLDIKSYCKIKLIYFRMSNIERYRVEVRKEYCI